MLSTNNHNDNIVDIYVCAHSNVPNDSWEESNGLSGGLLLLVVSDDVVARATRRCALLVDGDAQALLVDDVVQALL